MEHYNETYSIEIVHEPAEDGLTRPGMVGTKVTGLRELYHVEEFLHIFNDIQGRMPSSKVKLGRTIQFYCNVCRCLIGEKTIPLRIEKYRHMGYTSDPEISIQVEQYRCIACGHHTRYSIQDPMVRCY